MSLTGMTKGSSLVGKISSLAKIHGYSAYEVAVINGFSGTEEEWLASLKGEKGDPGESGVIFATYGETTFAEVYEAFTAGNAVFCKNGAVMLPMRRYYAGSNMAIFEGTYGGQIITYTVQNEAWTETAEELIEQLTVVISGTAASHSASEIIAAIKAEQIVEVNMGTERLQVTAWDESAVTVTCQKAPAPNRTGALLSCNEYTISDDKTVSVVANGAISNKFTAKAGQVVAVENGDPSGPTAFKAIDLREEFIATYGTTTFAEIWDAMSANKAVYCKNGNVTLPMTACSAQSLVAEFGGVTESGNVVWKVQNATWSTYNAELNDDCVKTVNGIAPDENGNVDLPMGGSSLPMPATASVGQYIVVSAVDENGKVTATEAVTMADAEEVAF